VQETRGHQRPIKEEGLVGTLFYPSTPGPHPAVIAFGGVGGGLREGGVEALASKGYAALTLAYFGVEGLPRELVEIPLEYFGKAIEWLKSQPEVDANRIAVVGNSKGGELALLLGATYPKDVRAVIGYASSGVVWQGITFDREVYHGGPRSPWALGGEPVPFARFASPLPAEMVRMVGFYFGRHPIVGRIFYERALKNETAIAAAEIAVEKIDGPVLLISGTDDQMWPSTRLSEMAIRRLDARGHPFPHEHLRYEGAGHMIAPPGYVPNAGWTNRFELGGTPHANEFANADSWPKVLGFLEEAFGHRA
jgi:uncharacterized protein